jgi:hypothetical protein
MYFDDLGQIEKSEFLERYAKHIRNREKPDSFEEGVFQGLKDAGDLACYLARLNEKGVDNDSAA